MPAHDMHVATHTHLPACIASASYLQASAASSSSAHTSQNEERGATSAQGTPQNFDFLPETSSKGMAGEPEPTHPPLTNQTLRLGFEENQLGPQNRSYASLEPKGSNEPPQACLEARNRAWAGRPMGGTGEEKMELIPPEDLRLESEQEADENRDLNNVYFTGNTLPQNAMANIQRARKKTRPVRFWLPSSLTLGAMNGFF